MSEFIQQRLELVRQEMAKSNLDAFIIPARMNTWGNTYRHKTNDFNGSVVFPDLLAWPLC